MEDITRHIIERAVQSARSLLSPQTGFVHYHPNVLDGQSAQSIPIYENLLYCLALFRTKTHDNIQEAKILFEKLAFFQQLDRDLECFGSFPLYLHEFPFCRDYLQSVKCIAPLYWIYKDYHHVIPETSRAKLKRSLFALVEFCTLLLKEIRLPLWARIKAIASSMAVAHLFDQTDLIEKAKQLLPTLDLSKDASSWNDPQNLAELVSSFHMIKDLIDASYFVPLWEHISYCFAYESKTYVGPGVHIEQQGKIAKTVLLDYYMWAFTQQIRKDKDIVGIDALQGASVFPENCLKPIALPIHTSGITDQFSWLVHQEKEWAFSCIRGSCEPQNTFGFFPFYFVAGPHSLCMQLFKGEVESFSYEGSKLLFIINFSPDIFLEGKDKNKMLSICLDDTNQNKILVEGIAATTFELENSLTIELGSLRLSCTMRLFEGAGRVMGHISRANRSAQLLARGKDKYSAFDQMIALRAIRGNEALKIRIEFQIAHLALDISNVQSRV
jgi:hypothetical protein